MKDIYKKKLLEIFDRSGIRVGGDNPWDIRVVNDRFYKKTALLGSLGLGESYVEGWWECDRIDQFVFRILCSGIDPSSLRSGERFEPLLRSLMLQTGSSPSWQLKVQHYDLGNDFFRAMLGKRMIYSCGYWKEAKTLEEAQEHKVDLVCHKLGLGKGMRVLDIGCGWGETLRLAHEKYGVEGTGITLSKEAYAYATRLTKDMPIRILLKDFRELQSEFDHIFSVGMFEHVGLANMADFMKTSKKSLGKDGLFLLHTIGNSRSHKRMDPWMEKYIFPNSFIPSPGQIIAASEGLFILEDWHNFGQDYDRTLMAWFENFERSWPDFEKEYGPVFYRVWKYYLQSNAGAFRSRYIHLWQIVFSEKGIVRGYRSKR